MLNHINMNPQDNKHSSKLDKELQAKGAENCGESHYGGVDPFYENWDEAELSSHNNVIIELVEIPHSAALQGRGRICPGTPASSSAVQNTLKSRSETIPFADEDISESKRKDSRSTDMR